LPAPCEDWRAELEEVLRKGKEKLVLSSCSLGDVGAREVAENLRANRNRVKELRLDDNEIGDAGATALAALLRQNIDERSAESASEMGDSSSGGAALEYLQLHGNAIGRKGIADLADALQNNTTLRWLVLGSNPARGGDIIDSLLSAIRVNTTLKWVIVTTLKYQETIQAALADTEAGNAAASSSCANSAPPVLPLRLHLIILLLLHFRRTKPRKPPQKRPLLSKSL
jgi:Leucine Rich repeat